MGVAQLLTALRLVDQHNGFEKGEHAVRFTIEREKLVVDCVLPSRIGMAPKFAAACITEPLSGRPATCILR